MGKEKGEVGKVGKRRGKGGGEKERERERINLKFNSIN